MNNCNDCKSGSNNIYADFPPLMSDGRNYSSWLPGDEINKSIRKSANITSNNDYRKYLVNNGETIMKYNSLQCCDECGSNLNLLNNEINSKTNAPYLFQSCYENVKPKGYETSDLKESYLSMYNLQSRLVTPVIDQNTLLENGYKNYQ